MTDSHMIHSDPEKKRSIFEGKMIALGVTGGIAAYKSAEITRLLIKKGAQVQVIMTENAKQFVTPLTFQALSGRPVISDLFLHHSPSGIQHTELADLIDLLLIAPATANIIGKITVGIADDFLSTFAMATDVPLVIAPAMNPRMYANPVLQHNLQTLSARGVMIIEPEIGESACGHIGRGRMSEPVKIIDFCGVRLGRNLELKGKRVLITAGPTREAIDPVRFISNRSTGLMGFEMAAAAVERGADVILIAGTSCTIDLHAAVRRIDVESADQMFQAVQLHAADMDIIVMAAAVSDWRPRDVYTQKWKKSGQNNTTLNLVQTTDILSDVSLKRRRENQIIVGFAAETENIVEEARRKWKQKKLDFIVANDVSRHDTGFESPTNAGFMIHPDGHTTPLPLHSKREMSEKIWDHIADSFASFPGWEAR